MLIGQRLREIREAKNLTQADIERRSGLLRSYTSTVENGHTVPSLETIEKFARGLGIPTYQLFIGADEEPKPALRALPKKRKMNSFGGGRKEGQYLLQLRSLLAKMSEPNRALLLSLAVAMAKRKRRIRGRKIGTSGDGHS